MIGCASGRGPTAGRGRSDRPPGRLRARCVSVWFPSVTLGLRGARGGSGRRRFLPRADGPPI